MINQLHTSAEEPRYTRLWVLWMLFFFQYAAIGVYFTFLNVYFRQAGLSGTQTGVLNMTTALVGVGSSVIWGYLSDRTGQPRLMISLGALGALLVAQAIPYVDGFWAFLALGCLGSAMNSAPGTLTDSTAVVLLGKRREEYGRYRLGGTFGYIITALASGFLFERIGLQAMFPAYGVTMLCFALSALLLPSVAVRMESRGPNPIGKMITRPAWLLFIMVLFLCWIAANASIMFLGVSLSAMGASQSLIGIVATVPAMAEIPFMFYSGALLRRFGSVPLLIIGIVLMVIRFFLLGFMPAPEWAIAINLINGPAFVFFWNSAVNYANEMAPPGMAGTAQGMLASTASLAGVVSSLLSGWLLDQLGPNGIFQVMAVLVLVALLLFLSGRWMLRSPQQNGV